MVILWLYVTANIMSHDSCSQNWFGLFLERRDGKSYRFFLRRHTWGSVAGHIGNLACHDGVFCIGHTEFASECYCTRPHFELGVECLIEYCCCFYRRFEIADKAYACGGFEIEGCGTGTTIGISFCPINMVSVGNNGFDGQNTLCRWGHFDETAPFHGRSRLGGSRAYA